MLDFNVNFLRSFGAACVLGLGACSGGSDVPGTTGGSTTGLSGTTESGATAGVDAGNTTGSSVATSGSSGLTGSPSPTSGSVPAEPTRDPIVLDECGDGSSAGLTPDQVAALKAGGGTPVRMLYPYDKTVFPRGLRSPTMMWQDDGSTMAYVHIHAEFFDYQGCLPVEAGRMRVPQEVWDTAGVQTGVRAGGVPYTLEITTLSGAQANGPAVQTFTIAKGALTGSIYYNSYNSRIAAGGAIPGAEDLGGLGDLFGGGLPTGGFGGGGDGAVLRLRPGQDAELFARQGTCVGCHSLSANGERMLAASVAGGGFGGIGGIAGDIYEIGPDTGPNPTPLREGAQGISFGALTPDGRYYLASGASAGFGPPLMGSQAPPETAAALYETDTGTPIANTGIPTSAMMPNFSPDGTLLVFNDFTVNGGRSLTVMDFDPAQNVASNARVVYSNDRFGVGWPFFLPDNRGIVFSITESASFSGESSFIRGPGAGPYSELMFLDLRSGEANLMARAMGYASLDDAAAGTSYLPFGLEEMGQVYYPTVSPLAAGGYFWVFFDTNRHYGNTGFRRQIWGVAIAIPNSEEFDFYQPDPSFPAFYLEGQEIDVANHRAFTVLDPCKEDGESCESGVDCCSGFCTDGICGYDAPRCSEIGEACETADDCCDEAAQCINGFCAVVII